MISCKLKGGLGNQLFQISATYSLAKENNDEECYKFEESELYFQGKRANTYLDTIYKKFQNKICNNINFENFYHEQRHSYDSIEYRPNLLIEGYFQSEKYFINFKDEIINLFDLEDKKEKCLNFLKQFDKPITSIHIRRGDYLKLTHIFKILNLDYYHEAIRLFPDNHFLVFSYDKDNWLFENFNGKNFTIVNFEDELEDFTCMSLCDNNIIANSTFSWWASYLNKNKNKKIISPKTWFSTKNIDEHDIIPNDWIKI